MTALSDKQKSIIVSLLNKEWLKAKTPPEKLMLASAMQKLMGIKPSKTIVSIIAKDGTVLYKGTNSNRAIEKAETSGVACKLVSTNVYSNFVPNRGWMPLREIRT